MKVSMRGAAAALFVCAAFEAAFAHHPIINEFIADHEGDDTHEFIEIIFLPFTDLSVFSLVVVEGDQGENPGEIDAVFQLGTTGENWLWRTGFQEDVLENGTLTILLVLNFTGSVGQDVDTDDDGMFDARPWAWISDEVGVNDGGKGDLNYTEIVLETNTPAPGETVGGASRVPNGMLTYSINDWRRNAFNGEGIPDLPGGPVDFCEAYNTPGEPNDAPEPAWPARSLRCP